MVGDSFDDGLQSRRRGRALHLEEDSGALSFPQLEGESDEARRKSVRDADDDLYEVKRGQRR